MEDDGKKNASKSEYHIQKTTPKAVTKEKEVHTVGKKEKLSVTKVIQSKEIIKRQNENIQKTKKAYNH
jgi:hypothetical protein